MSSPTKTWKNRVKEIGKRVLSEGSKGRVAAQAGLQTYRESHELTRRVKQIWRTAGIKPESYDSWRTRSTTSAEELQHQRQWVAAATSLPAIDVVVLPGGADAQATRDSIADQTLAPCRVLTALTADDVRAAIESSTGDLMTFVAAGANLAPDAIFSIGTTYRRDPALQVVTWDTEYLATAGLVEPAFRPSWSPEMLVGENYIGTAFAASPKELQRVGAFEPISSEGKRSLEGAIWDALLRLNPEKARTTHIERLLSSEVRLPRVGEREAALVVQSYLDRTGIDATAERSPLGIQRVRFARPSAKVSIVIPTRHNRTMLGRLLPSLATTDYPSFDVHIMDNGGESTENEQWYDEHSRGLDLTVSWWTEQPFNYSRVNNVGARATDGEVLLFLNDDTEITDPGWLTELVGWALQPGIGTVGPRLIGPDGEIQHMGVWLGMGGFADHLFQGMRPGADSIFGSTDSYRNTLAVTGACVAVRRSLFEKIGGFDERFQLTGSDVALGLDCVMAGLRNVCTPHAPLRHFESVTRGTDIPESDFFASYWKYNTWLFAGDPYFNSNLSLTSRTPRMRGEAEPTVRDLLEIPLGRNFTAFRQTSDADESRMLAEMCNADRSVVDAVRQLHEQNAGPIDVKTINWFIPDIDSPFYGGINTAFRIADYLARHHGVENRMITLGQDVRFIRSALAASFPALADSPIIPIGGNFQSLDVPEADAAIATLWVTAFALAQAQNQKRKFYLVQDFEPMFYPAGTNYALTEETYRLGLYAICNTHNLKKIYTEDYGGKAMSFMPAVDDSIFHARGRVEADDDEPVTIFVYARPGHWRNCWEMAAPALEKVKATLGNRVRIVTAGAWATGSGAQYDIKPLGLMPYRMTGEQYRRTDVGLALTVSKHPSYLPLELMSCGAPVVAFDNSWGHWILEDGENSLLCMRTIDDMADQLIRLASDTELRRHLQKNALADIAERHNDWEQALSGIYGYLCDPDRAES